MGCVTCTTEESKIHMFGDAMGVQQDRVTEMLELFLFDCVILAVGPQQYKHDTVSSDTVFHVLDLVSVELCVKILGGHASR